MTFLPVVERELRVAARKRATYWLRVGAAGFLCALLALVWNSHTLFGGAPGSMGAMLFSPLKWTCFVYAFLAGLFLTSDAISEEKREGTLGLLFLTPLRGYDVVLGKLLASSANATYALVAGVPVLALPILMGGVSGDETGVPPG